MKILFTGGGSGGHVVPIIALARELRKITTSNLGIFYIGPEDEFNELLLSQEGIRVFHIQAGKVRRYFTFKTIFQNLFDLLIKTPLGIVQAFWRIFVLAPDVIFSKGGYGAIPATVAGKLLGIPIFLHESDIIPGMANRIGGRFSSRVFVSFPHTAYFPPQKTILTGNPIRKEILTGSKTQAQELFHITGEKPVLLILGGSQGAQRINNLMLLILNDLLASFEIIHQTGENNFSQVRAEAHAVTLEEKQKYYHPVPFLKETDLRHAYAAADFIISRAGAGSIFEFAALGKPSILIPLPESAQGHQIQNAYAYAATGAAIVLEEANLKPHFFLEKLKYLFSSPQELEKMKNAALAFAKPDSAKVIADTLVAYLNK